MFDRPLSMGFDGTVLTLGGTVDEYAVADLRQRLADLDATVADLVVNLSDVDFLPSAGIGVLVRARTTRRAQGRSLTLVALEDSPAGRTLALTGIAFEPDLQGPATDSVG